MGVITADEFQNPHMMGVITAKLQDPHTMEVITADGFQDPHMMGVITAKLQDPHAHHAGDHC